MSEEPKLPERLLRAQWSDRSCYVDCTEEAVDGLAKNYLMDHDYDQTGLMFELVPNSSSLAFCSHAKGDESGEWMCDHDGNKGPTLWGVLLKSDLFKHHAIWDYRS